MRFSFQFYEKMRMFLFKVIAIKKFERMLARDANLPFARWAKPSQGIDARPSSPRRRETRPRLGQQSTHRTSRLSTRAAVFFRPRLRQKSSASFATSGMRFVP